MLSTRHLMATQQIKTTDTNVLISTKYMVHECSGYELLFTHEYDRDKCLASLGSCVAITCQL